MDALPRDLVLYLADLLPVQDLLALRATCSAVHEALEDRSVWRRALSRVLAQSSSPALSATLSTLGSTELFKGACRSLALDRAFARDRIAPFRCMAPVPSDVLAFRMVPGGQYFLFLRHGALELRPVDGGARVIVRLPGAPWTGHLTVLSLQMYPNKTGEIFVLVHVHLRDRREACVAVYALDIMSALPAVTLLHASTQASFAECAVSVDNRSLITLSSAGDDPATAILSLYSFATFDSDAQDPYIGGGGEVPASSNFKIPLRLDPLFHNALTILNDDTIVVHDVDGLKVFGMPTSPVDASSTSATVGPSDVPAVASTPAVLPVFQHMPFPPITPSAFPSSDGSSCALLTTSGSARTVYSLSRATPTAPFVLRSTELSPPTEATNYGVFNVLPGARWAGLYDGGCVDSGSMAIEWMRLPSGPEGDAVSADVGRGNSGGRCGGRMTLHWPRPMRDASFDEASGRVSFLDDAAGGPAQVIVVDVLSFRAV